VTIKNEKTVFLILFLSSLVCHDPYTAEAQQAGQNGREFRPGFFQKSTFLDAQVSTARFEVGVSERIMDRVLLGMYVSFFWEDPLETTSDEEFAIEARSKVYFKKEPGEWFIAPSAGIVNLTDTLEGIVSTSIGYDHLFPVSLFTNTTRFRIGFFVEGAILSNGNGFGGLGIGVGF